MDRAILESGPDLSIPFFKRSKGKKKNFFLIFKFDKDIQLSPKLFIPYEKT